MQIITISWLYNFQPVNSYFSWSQSFKFLVLCGDCGTVWKTQQVTTHYHKNHQNPIHVMFVAVQSVLTCAVCTLYWETELCYQRQTPSTYCEQRPCQSPEPGPYLISGVPCLRVFVTVSVRGSASLESSVHLVSWRVRAVTFQFIPFMWLDLYIVGEI